MYENDGGALPKVHFTPRLTRVVLKAKLHRGQQDQRNQDARSLWDPPSESKSCRETWNNAVDYRIPGILLSTVELQDTNRQNKVKKWIDQTQKINKFSKESQELIADMNNTEIFELCENSSSKQCADCNTHREIGIVYCGCGRNMKSTRSPTEFEQNNRSPDT